MVFIGSSIFPNYHKHLSITKPYETIYKHNHIDNTQSNPTQCMRIVLIRFPIYQRIIVYITNGNSNIISNVIATQYTLKTVIEV